MAEAAETSWRPPRVCEDYWSEFRFCSSLTNKFHHYYAYGSSPTCQEWKEDYRACRDWEQNHNTKSKDALQSSERKRLSAQKNFVPVWNLRKEPPSDWHMPLEPPTPEQH